MKTVTLRFEGGVIPAAQLEIENEPTQPVIVVPVPGNGFAMHNFRFRQLEWDDENKREVYIFDGIDA